MSEADPNDAAKKREGTPVPEDVSVSAEHLAEEQLFYEAALRLERQQTVTEQGIRRALNVAVERITDPAAGPRFATRHNVHVRSPKIAAAMYDVYARMNMKVAEQYLEDERRHAQDAGIFVFPYSPEVLQEHIGARYPDGTQEYLLMESSGSHPRAGHPRFGKPRPAADAQFHLPEARFGAAAVFERPEPDRQPLGDSITSRVLLEQMSERPYAVAQLDDIVSDPDMGHLGLASHALDRGLHYIAEVINPARGDKPIEFLVAEIVSIKGVVLHSGDMLFFNEEIPGTPILNGRSMMLFDHFRSDVITHFTPVWTREHRVVPVQGHLHVQGLLASWYAKAARFKK